MIHGLGNSSDECRVGGEFGTQYPGHSSDECKILGKFGTKYYASQPTKNRGSNPIPKKGYWKKQEHHTIIDNMVNELHMFESKKVSAVNHEARKKLESD